MKPSDFANLKVQRLSPLFRWKYWTRHGDEPDARVLWPGIRQEISLWLARRTPVVIAALAASSNFTVASRSLFSRSLILDELWYYGYFYTLPNFRRQGLGEFVMRKGLAEIWKAGGRFCSCYIAADNQSSADLATKLGFRRLPFVRLVFRGGEHTATYSIRQRMAETTDIRVLDGSADLIKTIAGSPEGLPVITEELFIPQPWQPWKRAESRLVRFEHEGRNLGIGRIGPHKAVFLPDQEVLGCNSAELLLSIVTAIQNSNQSPVHAFLPTHALGKLHEHKCQYTYEVYDVFWNSMHHNTTELSEPHQFDASASP